jgi:hypothetical protein
MLILTRDAVCLSFLSERFAVQYRYGVGQAGGALPAARELVATCKFATQAKAKKES